MHNSHGQSTQETVGAVIDRPRADVGIGPYEPLGMSLLSRPFILCHPERRCATAGSSCIMRCDSVLPVTRSVSLPLCHPALKRVVPADSSCTMQCDSLLPVTRSVSLPFCHPERNEVEPKDP